MKSPMIVIKRINTTIASETSQPVVLDNSALKTASRIPIPPGAPGTTKPASHAVLNANMHGSKFNSSCFKELIAPFPTIHVAVPHIKRKKI
jgi:hypothetical protein